METRSLSDVICDNTYIERVQAQALLSPHPNTNPIRPCVRPDTSASVPATTTPNPDSLAAPAAPAPSLLQDPELQRVPKSLSDPAPGLLFTDPPGFPLRPRAPLTSFRNSPSIFEAGLTF